MTSARAFILYALAFTLLLALLGLVLSGDDWWNKSGAIASYLGCVISLWTFALVLDAKREVLLKRRASNISKQLSNFVSVLYGQLDNFENDPAAVQVTLGKCYGLLSGLKSKLSGEHQPILRKALDLTRGALPHRRWLWGKAAITYDGAWDVYVALLALDTALREVTKDLKVS
jgi:hypothetical protein